MGKSLTRTRFLPLIVMPVMTAMAGATLTRAADLEVKVTGFRQKGGTVMAALDREAASFADGDTTPFREQIVPVTQATVTVRFERIPNGIYAIKLFHDENGDRELTTNLLGVPTEPYGVSQNARARFGLPDFDEAKFTVTGETTRISISVSPHSILF